MGRLKNPLRRKTGRELPWKAMGKPADCEPGVTRWTLCRGNAIHNWKVVRRKSSREIRDHMLNVAGTVICRKLPALSGRSRKSLRKDSQCLKKSSTSKF
jgi:hypothetical protein